MQVYSKPAQGRHGRNESARAAAVRTGLNSGLVYRLVGSHPDVATVYPSELLLLNP